MSASPLPKGNNAAEMIRRLRAIDAEIFGTLYANAGIIGGDVEIQGALIANDIYSENWVSGGGTVPLSLPDVSATTGYAFQSATGVGQFAELHATGANITNLVAANITGTIEEAQIADNAVTFGKLNITSLDAITANMGTLTINETLTMDTGSLLRSGSSGLRWETDVDPQAEFRFYTGDADEVLPALIRLLTFPRDDPSQGLHALWITSPNMNENNSVGIYVNGQDFVQLNQGGANVSLAGGGVSLQADLTGISIFCDTADEQVQFSEGNPLSGAQGSESKPLLTVFNDLDTGFYWEGSNNAAVTVGGKRAMDWHKNGAVAQSRLTSGTALLPSLTFIADNNTGMYRPGENVVAFSTGGALRGSFQADGLYATTPNTTGLGTAIHTSGAGHNNFQRFTSARKYKSRINYNMDFLADIELKPAKFYRKDDKAWSYGFIAEDFADQDKLLGVYDEGEVENFADRGVLAVMAAKINRLEARVEELSK